MIGVQRHFDANAKLPLCVHDACKRAVHGRALATSVRVSPGCTKLCHGMLLATQLGTVRRSGVGRSRCAAAWLRIGVDARRGAYVSSRAVPRPPRKRRCARRS